MGDGQKMGKWQTQNPEEKCPSNPCLVLLVFPPPKREENDKDRGLTRDETSSSQSLCQACYDD